MKNAFIPDVYKLLASELTAFCKNQLIFISNISRLYIFVLLMATKNYQIVLYSTVNIISKNQQHLVTTTPLIRQP